MFYGILSKDSAVILRFVDDALCKQTFESLVLLRPSMVAVVHVADNL
jgi:hypothetical protein